MLVKFVKSRGGAATISSWQSTNREGAFRPDCRDISPPLCDRPFGIGADRSLQWTLRVERRAGHCSMLLLQRRRGRQGRSAGNGAPLRRRSSPTHLGIGGETKYFDATDGVHTAHIRRAQGRGRNRAGHDKCIGNPQRRRLVVPQYGGSPLRGNGA